VKAEIRRPKAEGRPKSEGRNPKAKGGTCYLIGLSERQKEVLTGIAENRTIKEIAHDLRLSPKTAEYHRARLCARLGVRGTAALTVAAIKGGLMQV
jgi:two-component system response regulator FixJ